jgi:hypothetical protein
MQSIFVCRHAVAVAAVSSHNVMHVLAEDQIMITLQHDSKQNNTLS